MINSAKIYSGRILLFLLLSLAFITHFKRAGTPDFDYRAELWADQAGYYIYLPALFIYDMDAREIPADMEEKLGCGFRSHRNSFFTKYPAGVALLQLPFFAVVHTWQHLSGGITDGYSGFYQQVPNLAAVFYAAVGAFLFFRLLLLRKIPVRLSWMLSLCLVFGTHLLYYTTYYGGMSHVYSFFLITAFMYLLQRAIGKGGAGLPTYLALGALAGALLICRPTNLMLLFFVMLLFLLEDRGSLLRLLNNRRTLASLLMAGVVVFIQLLYWHHISGDWIYYSYQGEGFSNWQQPYFLEVWFSPNNGLFPYTPIFLLVLGAIVWSFSGKLKKALLYSFSFLALSYMVASWHQFHFGISFGSRNFVEYLPFFFLPLAEMLHHFKPGRKYIGLVAAAIFMVLYNLKLSYTYDMQFGGQNWEWDNYRQLALRGARGGSFSFGIISENHSPPAYSINNFSELGYTFHELRCVDLWGKVKVLSGGENAHLVVSVTHNDSLYYWQGTSLSNYGGTENSGDFYARYVFAGGIPRRADLKVFVWRDEKDSLKINDLHIRLK